MRRQEVTPERLGETGDAELSDEAAERAARTCWVIRRRLGKVGETLGRLDFSGMEIAPFGRGVRGIRLAGRHGLKSA